MPLWTSVYPTALDVFTAAPQVDGVNTVFANNVNVPAASVEAIQAKLGITGGNATGFGGYSFQAAGKAAFPGAGGDPTLWVDNSSGPGFVLTYTDELGTNWPLSSLYDTGVGYTVADPAIAVGDLVGVDPAGAADDVVRADANAGTVYQMHGVVIGIYGAGTLCDIMYSGEIQNAAWTGLFTQGAPVYLGTKGVVNGLVAAPPGGIGSIQQGIGFFRNTDTLVIRPSLVTTI